MSLAAFALLALRVSAVSSMTTTSVDVLPALAADAPVGPAARAELVSAIAIASPS
jgi:hypothetical protein